MLVVAVAVVDVIVAASVVVAATDFVRIVPIMYSSVRSGGLDLKDNIQWLAAGYNLATRSHWQKEAGDALANNLVAVIIQKIPSDLLVEAGALKELVERGMQACPEVFSVARSFLLQVTYSLLLYYPFIVWRRMLGMELKPNPDAIWGGWVARL